MNPKVSVLMITYKHEKFIEKAINSVLEQETNFDFELIIANDNSPDKTNEIINTILENHPKANQIRYLKNEVNLGPNVNYIKAYESGIGKYVAICEGDDFWGDITKLQKQVDFLDQNPEYVLTYHDVKYVDDNGILFKKNSNGRPKEEITQMDLMKGKQPLFLTTCYRKLPIEIPKEMGDIVNGDTFLTSILGNYGKGKRLNIKPAFYRHHSGGIWSLQNKEYKFKAKIQLFSMLKDYYESKGLEPLIDYFANQIYSYQKMLLWLYFKEKNFTGIKSVFKGCFNLKLKNIKCL